MSLFWAGVAAFICFIGGFVLSSLFTSSRLEDRETAKNYLTELFMLLAPQCIPGDSATDLVMQIENYIAGQNIRIEELESEGIVQLKRMLELVMEKADEILPKTEIV